MSGAEWLDLQSPQVRQKPSRATVAVDRQRASTNLTVKQQTRLLASHAVLPSKQGQKDGVEALEAEHGVGAGYVR